MPCGHLELVHGLAQLGALVALDAARDAAAARVVRHQHEVAAGERDVGGERRPLVAALVLLDLDDEFLAFLQRFLDRGLAGVDAGLEVGAGDFLERQEAVAIGTVVYEGRFEAGLDTGDDRLVDVALAFFFCGRFDIEVDQFLTVHDCDAQFLGLRRVEKHALHLCRSPAQYTRAGRTARTIALSGIRSDWVGLLSSGDVDLGSDGSGWSKFSCSRPPGHCHRTAGTFDPACVLRV